MGAELKKKQMSDRKWDELDLFGRPTILRQFSKHKGIFRVYHTGQDKKLLNQLAAIVSSTDYKLRCE